MTSSNRVRSSAFALAALSIAATCEAQIFVTRDTPRRGSIEVSGGGVYQGGTDLGAQTATQTRNPTTGSGPLPLFTADTTLASVVGGQARLGYYLSSAISLEAGVQYAKPRLEVSLRNDFEDAPQALATETLNSYLFTGSFLYHIGRGRLRPFLVAGAGHVRDLHAGDEVVETGAEYHAGGGVKWWFGGGRQKFGLRADALFSSRDGGVGADEDRRTVPTGTFSLSYVF